MTPVAGKADALEVLVAFGQLLNDVPGIVLGAVVHKNHPAFRGNPALFNQAVDFFQEHAAGHGQNLLLVVAGDHDV